MDVIAIGESLVSFTPSTRGFLRHAASFTSRIAGSETNMLIGLSRLGHTTGWISKVGNDELGKMLLARVKGEGVDTSQVIIEEVSQTGLFFKEIINESDVRITYYRKDSAAATMNEEILSKSYFERAKYLFITGITPALSKTCKTTIFKAIELAKVNDLTIVFDPNIRRKLWEKDVARETILEIAKNADIILPGRSEGYFLFETDNEKEISENFLSLGATLVVVKLGAKGAYYSTEQESQYVPGFRVENVVDPVGAGDGFAAGLISGLLDEKDVREAVARACAVGALATKVDGDYEGLPERDGLNEFINQDQFDDVSR